MFPIHGLEHDLSIGVAIEDESRGITIVAHCVQHAPGDLAVEQPSRQCRPIGAALDGPVADDQRDRGRQRVGHRPGKGIAAPGDERDVNAGGNGRVNRVAIDVRQLPLTVEKRTVHIDANQSNHAQFRGRPCPQLRSA